MSGTGLKNLLEFSKLQYAAEQLPDDLPAGAVIALFAAQSKACALARKIFLRSLGSVCADSILRTKAQRLILCGGVIAKWQDHLREDDFVTGFSNKAPMNHIVRSTRLEVSTNEQIGLLGAAAVAKSLL